MQNQSFRQSYDNRVFGCCAFIPLGFILIAAPMLAAGRGWRAFWFTATVEIVLMLLMVGGTLWSTMTQGGDWTYGGMVLMGITTFVILPLTMGGVILYARKAEGEMPGQICRVCGYDLRASPDRCPECGTPVKFDPDKF
jgi:hypothetical protein